MELAILDFIQQNLRTSFGDKIMIAITHLGDAGIIWIVLALALLISKKQRKMGIVLAVALIFDLLLCNCLLKPMIERIRPYEIAGIVPLTGFESSFSFPSGHTAGSFASAFALLFCKSKFTIYYFILASLIAFSRMYLYLHYPTDILGGIVVGFVSALLAKLIYDKYLDKKLRS